MEELRNQLNALTHKDVIRRIDFLNEAQRNELKRTILKQWMGSLPQDDHDLKEWQNLKFYFYTSPILLIGARLLGDYAMKTELRKNKYVRAMIYKKGIGLGCVLMLIPLHQTVKYTMKVGYKQFILLNQ